MKTENNIRNKAKFFAQYWGQEVISSVNHSNAGLKPLPVNSGLMGSLYTYSAPRLLLTPLSQISDEDVKEVSRILDFHDGNGLLIDRVPRGSIPTIEIRAYDRYNDCPNKINTLKFFTDDVEFFSIDENGGVFSYDCNRILNVMDYLRSKGYLLPWMALTVEDIVSYGWAKIKGGEE